MPVWDEVLMCEVDGWDYDGAVLRIDVPEGQCTDMAGACGMGQRAGARVVDVYAGGEADISYHRNSNGEWFVARDHRARRQNAPSASA